MVKQNFLCLLQWKCTWPLQPQAHHIVMNADHHLACDEDNTPDPYWLELQLHFCRINICTYVRTFNTKNITCYIYTLSHLQACSVYTSILQWCSMKYQGDYNNNVSLHFIYNKSPKKISNPGAVFHPINETVKQQWPNGFFFCLLFIVTADYAISANRLLNFMWLRNLFLPKKRNYKCTWILFMWGI